MKYIFTGRAKTAAGLVVKAQMSRRCARRSVPPLRKTATRGDDGRIFNANIPRTSWGDERHRPGHRSRLLRAGKRRRTRDKRRDPPATPVPTTFMRIGNFTRSRSPRQTRPRQQGTCRSSRSSSSIGSKWGAVRDAARTFIDAFYRRRDRLQLVFYAGARRRGPHAAGSEFEPKRRLKDEIPNSLWGGTREAEGSGARGGRTATVALASSRACV